MYYLLRAVIVIIIINFFFPDGVIGIFDTIGQAVL